MADIMTCWMKGYRGKNNIYINDICQLLQESDIIPSTTERNFEWTDRSRIFTEKKENWMESWH